MRHNKKMFFFIFYLICVFAIGGLVFRLQKIPQTVVYTRNITGHSIIPTIPEIQLNPAPNEIIGTVIFPKLDVTVPLVYGYNVEYMEQYHDVVGLEAWNNFPGQDNKLYINGHRHLAFQNLKHLLLGDQVQIETTYGLFTYSVTTSPQIVLATDEVAVNYYLEDHDTMFSPQILRLQTCYPFEAGTPLDHRYLVDLVLIESNYYAHF